MPLIPPQQCSDEAQLMTYLVTAANLKENYSLHALTALCNTTKVNIIHDDYIRLHQNKSGDRPRLETRPYQT